MNPKDAFFICALVMLSGGLFTENRFLSGTMLFLSGVFIALAAS